MPRVRFISSAALTLALLCTIIVSIAPAVRAGDSPVNKLVIVSAVYGNLNDDKTLDVTQKVIAMIADNSLSVVASNGNFGEPAPNSPKQLKIGYTLAGVYRSKTVDEGETLDISTRLIILKGVYGGQPNGPSADVTEQLSDLVRKNRLTFKADNETFGDPANGVVKKLRVEYLYDGIKKSLVAAEGETVNLPEPRGGG